MKPAALHSPAGRRWSCVGINIWHGPDLYKIQFLDSGVFQLYRHGIENGRQVFSQHGEHETFDDALAAADELIQSEESADIAPTHRPRCVCGRPKGYGFAFCVGCSGLLRDVGVRVASLEEACSAKYDQAVEILRRHGRVAA